MKPIVFALVMAAAPAAFGMKYAPVNAPPILTSPVNLVLPPLVNNFTGCPSDSNTIAVGYELYLGGFRMLCADAGRVGFWTTMVEAPLVGQGASTPERFVCPSGMAFAGVQYIEGLIYPFPLCGELIPSLQSGTVTRKVLYSTNGAVVEKLSKTGDTAPGVVSCGPAGFIQTLKALRDTAGNLTGFTQICNSILTDAATKNAVSIDLAAKTVGQTYFLGRNDTQNFRVDVFNLGSATVPDSNITLELHYDGEAWQVLPFGLSCTPILAHAGLVDRIVVGERCSLGEVAVNGDAHEVTFQFKPLGPDITRPASTTPQPVVSVRVVLKDEQTQGADANAANDTAAFPVVLQ